MLTRIVTPQGVYEAIDQESEQAFEAAVVQNSKAIFGRERYYVDCKRIIGHRGKKTNIPDGYIIDLRGKLPRLYVVENELASHDLFRHIGVQLLEFSYSYSISSRQVKKVLIEEIGKVEEIKEGCNRYILTNGYRSIDHLVESLIDSGFAAIVVIDEATEELNKVVSKFSFPVNIIEFCKYKDTSGNSAYAFTPFLQDVEESLPKSKESSATLDIGELDTIVVPAREDGFQETFLGENRWYAIRMSSSIIPQIKYIAAYRVDPISAITHVAPVDKILPWGDTGKYCVEFSEPAEEIERVHLDGKGKQPRAPRYTSLERLKSAKTLTEVF